MEIYIYIYLKVEYEKRIRKEILLSMHLGRDEWIEWKSRNGGDVKCNVRRKEIIWIEGGDIFRAARRDGKQRGSEDNEVQGKQRLGG